MKTFSKIISALFSPLFVPTYGMILLSYLTVMSVIPAGIRWSAIGIIFVITCIIPLSGILSMYKMGFIKDAGLNERTERTAPYLLAAVCYIGAAFFLIRVGTPLWIAMFFAGGALAIGVNIIVNRWWKISAHAAAVGGLAALCFRMVASGYAIYNMNLWISGAVIVAGMVLSARIYLRCHTLMQLFCGTTNGFLCVWLLSML